MLFKLKTAIFKHLEKSTDTIEVAASSLLKLKCVQDIISETGEKVLSSCHSRKVGFSFTHYRYVPLMLPLPIFLNS